MIPLTVFNNRNFDCVTNNDLQSEILENKNKVYVLINQKYISDERELINCKVQLIVESWEREKNYYKHEKINQFYKTLLKVLNFKDQEYFEYEEMIRFLDKIRLLYKDQIENYSSFIDQKEFFKQLKPSQILEIFLQRYQAFQKDENLFLNYIEMYFDRLNQNFKCGLHQQIDKFLTGLKDCHNKVFIMKVVFDALPFTFFNAVEFGDNFIRIMKYMKNVNIEKIEQIFLTIKEEVESKVSLDWKATVSVELYMNFFKHSVKLYINSSQLGASDPENETAVLINLKDRISLQTDFEVESMACQTSQGHNTLQISSLISSFDMNVSTQFELNKKLFIEELRKKYEKEPNFNEICASLGFLLNIQSQTRIDISIILKPLRSILNRESRDFYEIIYSMLLFKENFSDIEVAHIAGLIDIIKEVPSGKRIEFINEIIILTNQRVSSVTIEISKLWNRLADEEKTNILDHISYLLKKRTLTTDYAIFELINNLLSVSTENRRRYLEKALDFIECKGKVDDSSFESNDQKEKVISLAQIIFEMRSLTLTYFCCESLFPDLFLPQIQNLFIHYANEEIEESDANQTNPAFEDISNHLYELFDSKKIIRECHKFLLYKLNSESASDQNKKDICKSMGKFLDVLQISENEELMTVYKFWEK